MGSLIQKKNGVIHLKCTVTIIDKNWVVTAAHCVKNKYDLTDYYVVVGSSNISDTSGDYWQEFQIHREDVFQHPTYPQVISKSTYVDIIRSCHILKINLGAKC